MFSVHVSDRPADDTHNYGHGKVESLSAFIEAGLMLGSSVLGLALGALPVLELLLEIFLFLQIK